MVRRARMDPRADGIEAAAWASAASGPTWHRHGAPQGAPFVAFGLELGGWLAREEPDWGNVG